MFIPDAHKGHELSWDPCLELNENITILNQVQGSAFECSHLTVPLDYFDQDSKTLSLDIFRVNATEEPVLGTVLINFGGPGGTGVENMHVWGRQMAANIGQQWNLVTWDPRGTGKTLPFDCSGNLTTGPAQTAHKRQESGLASGNLTEYFLNYGWESAGAQADQCLAAMNDTGRYIGTASTARDMMRIVDALSEDGLLRYYGWSYGTALGSYAAAMFPERVGRMVLDANINPHDYQAGHYGDFVRDADKTFTAFLDECLANGDDCALAQYTNATHTEDLLAAINALLDPPPAGSSDISVTWPAYFARASVIFQQLYYPSTWPRLAETITAMLNGSANSSTASTTNSTVNIEPYNLGQAWSVFGIRASDALWRTDSVEEYLPQVQYQESISAFKGVYSGIWPSARWKMDAVERYTGDFNVKTRHPILYVNGEYDPVTPLAHAYNASQSFQDSAVLPHSGYGHGIVVHPSACVAKNVQAYFKSGVLPDSGLRCEPDVGPWEIGGLIR